MCVCPFPNERASSVQVVTTFASYKRRLVKCNLIFSFKWRGPEIVLRCCRFMVKLLICFVLSRGDNKSGGWGDVLCVCSNTCSHEWSPWFYQWDQQRWCEFFYSHVNKETSGTITKSDKLTEDISCCSKNTSLSLVPSTLPPLRKYGKNRCGCLEDVQIKSWRRIKEHFCLILLFLQGYWCDGETLSQHESCPVTQLTTGSQTGLTISDKKHRWFFYFPLT